MPQEASGSRSSLTINTTSAWRTGTKVTRGHRCARATPADGSRVARQRHDSSWQQPRSHLSVTSIDQTRLPTDRVREWIAANVETTSSPGPVSVQTKAFSLTSRDCGDHGGDVGRCQLFFQRGRATPVRIDAGFTGWVFVTLDGRYIVTEPLYVLDVREWKQYALFESLQIPNYTTIEAISRDRKRLLISRRDCDCTDVRVEYYELTWP
jgi:hypothetical protein